MSTRSMTSQFSIDALHSMLDSMPRDRRRVYEAIASAPDGLTDEEIQLHLRMNPSTERPRRGELADAGLIAPIGKRKTRSGRGAAIWFVVKASAGQGVLF